MGNVLRHNLIFCGLLVFSLPSLAADLFENDQVLMIKLSGPLNTLIRNKEDEKAYPFVLQADDIDHQIELSVRGNSRKRICAFPPLRLELGEVIPETSAFFRQKNLKLVTHCNPSESAQANVLQEYAAYEFFSMLSEAAYQVRLLRIDYSDTDHKRSTQRWAFAIEPTTELAKRIDGERVRLPAVSLKSLNKQQEALMYVFQYLIGNTDWSLVSAETGDECCHNGKLIKKDQELLYVPYDFDLSGLVNARYAHPDPSFHIKKVTQRLYRGFCMDEPTLRSAIQKVRSHETDFKRIIDNLPDISKSELKKMHRFVDRFFKEANDEVKMLKSFEQRCHD
jgi:hypothetical protein